ncbi:retrovirus-related Pol polyprotein from transposon TNT 1-94 [Trichonephila clavipes]|nr:retrovirus-related Pol polyprotein from transposon TNT 1-94 [Trichonephila clavipes]
MKQDLEKTENAYLSSFTSKKSKTLPGATAAAHGDPNGKNDYQKKGSRKPSVLHLIPFGCLAYAGVPKQIRKKFDMRAKMGIMMGYAQRTKGYRIWLIDENKLVETINGFSDLSEQQEALMVEVTIPNCYKQAIRSRDASKWHDAMDKEINIMMERKVWDLVDHPDNIKILENRWVYTIKYDENNKIVRYKARLVARGNTQLRGESFDEVFSPVINFTIVRLFFTRTATAGSDVVQSGRPIFDDFFQHLWPYIGNNTANVVFQMVKRLWLIRIDQ